MPGLDINMIDDDPIIDGQSWFCVSYLPHPERQALFFNFRGAHKTKPDAEAYAHKLSEQQHNEIPIYIAPTGKFIEVPVPFGKNKEEVSKEVKQPTIDIKESDTELSDDILCMACYAQKKNYLYMPCRHVCFCHSCMINHSKQSSQCPICNAEADEIINIFF
jgi:hypothetical protein